MVIGKWLETDAHVYLLDEPTKGIDIGAKDELFVLLQQLADQGKGLLYFSSEMEELAAIADTIYILYKGRIVKKLEKEEAAPDTILYYASGGGLGDGTETNSNREHLISSIDTGQSWSSYLYSCFSVSRLPYFFTYDNLADILRSISIVTLVAIGVTFSLIVDGFDLSVGSTVSLTTVVTASFMIWYEQPLVVVLLVPILVGAAVGLLNAFLIVKIGIPDLLATLGMLYVIGGLQKTYTQGYSVYNKMPFPDGTTAPGSMTSSFLWLGQGKLVGIPVPVIIMVMAVCLVHLFLKYTRFGRMFYITGSNREAARLSGVPVQRVRTFAYLLSGIFAGLGGILFAARIGSGQTDAGAPLLWKLLPPYLLVFPSLGPANPMSSVPSLGLSLSGFF